MSPNPAHGSLVARRRAERREQCNQAQHARATGRCSGSTGKASDELVRDFSFLAAVTDRRHRSPAILRCIRDRRLGVRLGWRRTWRFRLGCSGVGVCDRVSAATTAIRTSPGPAASGCTGPNSVSTVSATVKPNLSSVGSVEPLYSKPLTTGLTPSGRLTPAPQPSTG